MTLLHYDEYFERELRVEKAVVRMTFASFPEVYMIASRMYSFGAFSILLIIAATSASLISGFT